MATDNTRKTSNIIHTVDKLDGEVVKKIENIVPDENGNVDLVGDSVIKISSGEGNKINFSADLSSYTKSDDLPEVNDGGIAMSASNGVKMSADSQNAKANQENDTTFKIESDLTYLNSSLSFAKTTDIGNGTISLNEGTGIKISGDNASANQSANTSWSVQTDNNYLNTTLNFAKTTDIGNGTISLTKGTGISVTGSNAKANQKTGTNWTVSLDATLGQLSDVAVSAAGSGDVLGYDSDNNQWIPVPAGSGGGDTVAGVTTLNAKDGNITLQSSDNSVNVGDVEDSNTKIDLTVNTSALSIPTGNLPISSEDETVKLLSNARGEFKIQAGYSEYQFETKGIIPASDGPNPNQILSILDVSGITVGDSISGTDIPDGTVVNAIESNSVTMSQPVSSGGGSQGDLLFTHAASGSEVFQDRIHIDENGNVMSSGTVYTPKVRSGVGSIAFGDTTTISAGVFNYRITNTGNHIFQSSGTNSRFTDQGDFLVGTSSVEAGFKSVIKQSDPTGTGVTRFITEHAVDDGSSVNQSLYVSCDPAESMAYVSNMKNYATQGGVLFLSQTSSGINFFGKTVFKATGTTTVSGSDDTYASISLDTQAELKLKNGGTYVPNSSSSLVHKEYIDNAITTVTAYVDAQIVTVKDYVDTEIGNISTDLPIEDAGKTVKIDGSASVITLSAGTKIVGYFSGSGDSQIRSATGSVTLYSGTVDSAPGLQVKEKYVGIGYGALTTYSLLVGSSPKGASNLNCFMAYSKFGPDQFFNGASKINNVYMVRSYPRFEEDVKIGSLYHFQAKDVPGGTNVKFDAEGKPTSTIAPSMITNGYGLNILSNSLGGSVSNYQIYLGAEKKTVTVNNTGASEGSTTVLSRNPYAKRYGIYQSDSEATNYYQGQICVKQIDSQQNDYQQNSNYLLYGWHDDPIPPAEQIPPAAEGSPDIPAMSFAKQGSFIGMLGNSVLFQSYGQGFETYCYADDYSGGSLLGIGASSVVLCRRNQVWDNDSKSFTREFSGKIGLSGDEVFFGTPASAVNWDWKIDSSHDLNARTATQKIYCQEYRGLNANSSARISVSDQITVTSPANPESPASADSRYLPTDSASIVLKQDLDELIWVGTQSEYDQIGLYSDKTLYCITG